MIKLGKDKVEKCDTHNIVYKIDCNDCDATYVGTSSRQLKKRQKEHEYCVKTGDEKYPLALHNKDTGYTFDFENIKILDKENIEYTRIFSGMIHIHLHDNTLNRMYHMHKLKDFYKDAINLIEKHKLRKKQ